MRVIAGTARGVPIAAPRGSGTRPITDRVKETLFAILGDRVPGARVLDLYAGSGAIGIEALSRGAARADFVEHGRPAIAALAANLEKTRLGEVASVHATDVDRFLRTTQIGPWDLVVLDPPYEARAIVPTLDAAAPHLARGAIVAAKHFWRTDIPDRTNRLSVVRRRRFGETMLTFLEESDS
jgi:16S rRNA (guanine(966)-N(2))-methyltransferase RsmD